MELPFCSGENDDSNHLNLGCSNFNIASVVAVPHHGDFMIFFRLLKRFFDPKYPGGATGTHAAMFKRGNDDNDDQCVGLRVPYVQNLQTCPYLL